MLKKILFGALTVLLALSLVGCGAKKDAAKPAEAPAEQKAEVTVEGSPDKAVLACAQLSAYGKTDAENQKAAGLTDEQVKGIKEKVLTPFVDAFKMYPLSDESVTKMTDKYVEKLQAATNIKATVKTEDKEHPVVELSAVTINQEGAAKLTETNEDLTTLATAYNELKAQGLTDEDLKTSPDFQQFALESIDNYINEFPLNPEAKLEVTCEAAKGSDGKMHWAPQNPEAVAKFVNGQK